MWNAVGHMIKSLGVIMDKWSCNPLHFISQWIKLNNVLLNILFTEAYCMLITEHGIM